MPRNGACWKELGRVGREASSSLLPSPVVVSKAQAACKPREGEGGSAFRKNSLIALFFRGERAFPRVLKPATPACWLLAADGNGGKEREREKSTFSARFHGRARRGILSSIQSEHSRVKWRPGQPKKERKKAGDGLIPPSCTRTNRASSLSSALAALSPPYLPVFFSPNGFLPRGIPMRYTMP